MKCLTRHCFYFFKKCIVLSLKAEDRETTSRGQWCSIMAPSSSLAGFDTPFICFLVPLLCCSFAHLSDCHRRRALTIYCPSKPSLNIYFQITIPLCMTVFLCIFHPLQSFYQNYFLLGSTNQFDHQKKKTKTKNNRIWCSSCNFPGEIRSQL